MLDKISTDQQRNPAGNIILNVLLSAPDNSTTYYSNYLVVYSHIYDPNQLHPSPHFSPHFSTVFSTSPHFSPIAPYWPLLHSSPQTRITFIPCLLITLLSSLLLVFLIKRYLRDCLVIYFSVAVYAASQVNRN